MDEDLPGVELNFARIPSRDYWISYQSKAVSVKTIWVSLESLQWVVVGLWVQPVTIKFRHGFPQVLYREPCN